MASATARSDTAMANPTDTKATIHTYTTTTAPTDTKAIIRPDTTAAIRSDVGYHWLRRLWPVVAGHRLSFAAAIAAGLGATAATVAVPAVIGRGVDTVARGDIPWSWAAALAGLAAIGFGLGFVYRFGVFRCAHRIEADLRCLMYDRLTELSFSYWDKARTGEIISRANSDVRSIQLLFAFIPLVGTQVVMLAMGTAAMLAMSPTLTLTALIPLPLVLYTGSRLRKRVFPLSWVTQARTAELTTIVDESIQGARIVRAFAQESSQVELLARSARRLRWAGTATADAKARYAPAMAVLPRLGLALVLLVGGLAAIDERLAVGDVVAFNAYVLIMAAPFRMIGFVLVQWQRASAAAQRVLQIIDERPEITERPEAVRLSTPPTGQVEFDRVEFDRVEFDRVEFDRVEFDRVEFDRVEFDRVEFAYPGSGTPVLKGLTLTVEPGETVVVTGRTGSGKSTLARLLPRFYDPDSGTVCIDGTDVRDLNLRDVRRAVAVVTEEPFLFAASVRDNVAFARPEASDADVAAALNDAAVDFIDDLPHGADTELAERGADISGGQRQRLAIARALLADPAVLVLDDATSAVDAEVEMRIHKALRKRRPQLTVILIAHRKSTIALADRVVFIADGVVAASGSHDHLSRTVPGYAEALADHDTAAHTSTDTAAHTSTV